MVWASARYGKCLVTRGVSALEATRRCSRVDAVTVGSIVSMATHRALSHRSARAESNDRESKGPHVSAETFCGATSYANTSRIRWALTTALRRTHGCTCQINDYVHIVITHVRVRAHTAFGHGRRETRSDLCRSVTSAHW